MRIIFPILYLLPFLGFSQTYFFEDFNYENFEEIDSLFQNRERNSIWSTYHSVRNIDINENGLIDDEELFKRTSIVDDPFNPDNKIIQFELNKIDPFFYAKYSCDDSKNGNVISDEVLNNNFTSSKELYCIDCSFSPQARTFPEYKTHMNRNEIAIYGRKGKLYKAKKDHWFGMQMLINKEYQLDTIQNGEIVAQFHLPVGKGTNPPIAMTIVKGRFKLVIIKNNDGKGDVYDLGPVEKEKWIKWKLHLVISKKDKKGLVEIWRDGKKIASIDGKNCHNNSRVYLKIGIYKWGWWDCSRPFNYSMYKSISYDKVWADKEDRLN